LQSSGWFSGISTSSPARWRLRGAILAPVPVDRPSL
jgi:hypothetical protein